MPGFGTLYLVIKVGYWHVVFAYYMQDLSCFVMDREVLLTTEIRVSQRITGKVSLSWTRYTFVIPNHIIVFYMKWFHHAQLLCNPLVLFGSSHPILLYAEYNSDRLQSTLGKLVGFLIDLRLVHCLVVKAFERKVSVHEVE